MNAIVCLKNYSNILRRISHLYWMWQGMFLLKMRKELRFSMLSLLLSLIVKPVILWVLRPLIRKPGMESRTNLHNSGGNSELLHHLVCCKPMGLNGIHLRVQRELTEGCS